MKITNKNKMITQEADEGKILTDGNGLYVKTVVMNQNGVLFVEVDISEMPVFDEPEPDVDNNDAIDAIYEVLNDNKLLS